MAGLFKNILQTLDDNPIKTLFAAGTFVASGGFITSNYLSSYKIESLKSELDVQKAHLEQYKTKADFLSKELETIRSENAEYRAWLNQAKDATPAIMPRITELKSYIAVLEKQIEKTGQDTSFEPQVMYAKRGLTVKYSGLEFTVQDITIEKQANIIVKFPDRDTKTALSVKGGEKFTYKFSQAEYTLAITGVYFIADLVEFSITRKKVAN